MCPGSRSDTYDISNGEEVRCLTLIRLKGVGTSSKIVWSNVWLVEWLFFKRQVSPFLLAISWRDAFRYDDDIRFVLDQYTSLDFYSASSLKQQSVDRHVPHSHTLSWLILRVWEETTNTNSIVFDWPDRDCRQRSTTSLPLYHWCGSIVRNDMEISIW
jgi:hypothetical protein